MRYRNTQTGVVVDVPAKIKTGAAWVLVEQDPAAPSALPEKKAATRKRRVKNDE